MSSVATFPLKEVANNSWVCEKGEVLVASLHFGKVYNN